MTWLRTVAFLLTGICLLGLFSTQASDTDFWWHLKTGQYVVERRALPVPDPFAYTTALQSAATPGENRVQHFNLTHEWLAQTLMYLVYMAGGIPAVILVRAALLACVCWMAGWLASRRSGSVYVGIAAAFAAASLAVEFTADRPALATFFFVGVFVVLLETRRCLWALPPLAFLWANAHGGFFLGWVVLAAYCADAFWVKAAGRKRLWIVAACAVAASGLNPNGFAVMATLLQYRQSALTGSLIEWQPPYLWGPPYAFDLLLYAAAAVLLFSWRKVRVADWILFGVFAAAALAAFRNIMLIGFLAPVIIAAYFPWRWRIAPPVLAWTVPAIIAAGLAGGIARGSLFQLRVAMWQFPSGAADFLLANPVAGRLFNTYEHGGYLIWRLWPRRQVFIDGRALSESAYRDYHQILYNPSASGKQINGPRAALLERYGVEVVVMNAFEYVSGVMYPLVLALGNPATADWQLVYDDPQALIFLRHPPPEIPVFKDKSQRVLDHLERECTVHIEHVPNTPLCARTLADLWIRSGDRVRARRLLELYLEHAPEKDAVAEEALRRLNARN